MADEITAAGYADLGIGTRIQNTWSYLEFQNPSGAKLLRIGTNDSRVVLNSATNKKVQYTITLKGSDSDISSSLPMTFGKVAVKNTNSDSAPAFGLTSFTDATLFTGSDELILTVPIGVLV